MVIRKTYPELQENHIIPMCEMLKCYHTDKSERIATYNDSKKNIVFPNGSRILYRYCDNPKDAERFQGTEVDVLFIDEATHQSEEKMKKLTACVRGVNSFPKRIYITCNPGGEGHEWVKRLFIDKNYHENERAEDYVFIQSFVTDNKALMKSDPDYIKQLEALPPKLRDAWLYGDWNIFSGQFFEDFVENPSPEACAETGYTADELRQQHRYCHVIPPIDLSKGEPRSWTILRSFDFGYNKPFSCAWWAVDYDGVLYRILELYGCTNTPNEGVKWTPDKQAEEVARIEREHPWLKGKEIHGVADPSIWDASRGESVADTFMKRGVYFTPGDNQRIPGWMQIHYRFQMDSEGYSRMYVFDNCKAFRRTIPLLIYDEHKVEDLDTSMEDHCLTGDTQVLTESGYKDLRSLVGTEGYVCSDDGKLHRYYDVRLTRKQADIYAIELEDGTKIYCTDDHRFMLPNGEWITAGSLSAGAEVKTYGSSDYQQHSTEV